MKLFYRTLLTFLLAGLLLSGNVRAACCNAGFSSTTIPSTAKNWFRFIMHDSAATDIQSVQWSFGDSTYSNERTPSHAYYNTGEYPVTLTVIKKTENGVQRSCTETRVISVVYQCSDFTYITSQLNASFFQTTNFPVDSTSAWARSRRFTWLFGDGQSSNTLSPTHTYAQSGTYNVCLIQSKANSPDVITCSVCHTVVIKDTIPMICRSDFSYTLTDTVVSLHSNSTIGNSYWWIQGDTNAHTWGNNAGFAVSSEDSFTVCHRQYTDSIVGPGSTYCEECNTIRPPVDTTHVICRSDFSYTLTDTVVFLHSNSTIGNSYWWIQGDTNAHTWGNNAGFAVSSEDSFTVCHRQYTDSIVGPGSTYCEECNVIRSVPPVDTMPVVCYSNFVYNVSGLTVTAYVDSFNYAKNVWKFENDAVVYDTLLASYTFTSPGTKRICQTIFTNGSLDSCTTCKDVLIEAADISIHPNPAVHQITVKSKDGLISSIDVYDINGTRVKNISGLNVVKYDVNVSDLTSGIYYVSAVLEDGRVNKTKIIIQ
jgi:PKD repeat protein